MSVLSKRATVLFILIMFIIGGSGCANLAPSEYSNKKDPSSNDLISFNAKTMMYNQKLALKDNSLEELNDTTMNTKVENEIFTLNTKTNNLNSSNSAAFEISTIEQNQKGMIKNKSAEITVSPSPGANNITNNISALNEYSNENFTKGLETLSEGDGTASAYVGALSDPSQDGWTKVGSIQKGERINIFASGKGVFDPGMGYTTSDGEWYDSDSNLGKRYDPNAYYSVAPIGELIGAILSLDGSIISGPFSVGDSYLTTADVGGILALAYNDCPYQYGNNSGGYDVIISLWYPTELWPYNPTGFNLTLAKRAAEYSMLAYDDYKMVGEDKYINLKHRSPDHTPDSLYRKLEYQRFSYIQPFNYDEHISSQPNPHNVSFVLANKDVMYNGTIRKLITVIIRGTDSVEWEGNMDVTGTSYDPNCINHWSFDSAKQDVIDKLHQYLIYRGISNPLYLVTGHSRGGAVANLVANYLTNTNSDVFAYTFATPNVTKKANKNCSNIFNFCFEDDFVPQLPLRRWGYDKHGITIKAVANTLYGSNEGFRSDMNYFTAKSYNKSPSFNAGYTKALIAYSGDEWPSVEDYYNKKSYKMPTYNYIDITLYEFFRNCLAPAAMGVNTDKIKGKLTSLVFMPLAAFFILGSGTTMINLNGGGEYNTSLTLASYVNDTHQMFNYYAALKNHGFNLVSMESSSSMMVGQSKQLVATVLQNDTTNNNVLWSVRSGNGVVRVTNGLVEALTPGQAIIRATLRSDSNIFTECTVGVLSEPLPPPPPTPSEAWINLTSSINLMVGQKEQLTATLSPNTTTNKNILWSVRSGDGVVRVTNGLVEALAPGQAIIRAALEADSSIFAECIVGVLYEPLPSLISSGKTYSLETKNPPTNFLSNYNIQEVDKMKAFAQQGDNLHNLEWNLDDISTWKGVIWSDDIERKIVSINFGHKYLTGVLDVSEFSNLEVLNASGNLLTGIILTGCSSLFYIDCSNNQLTQLSASNIQSLRTIKCAWNNIAEINVDGCTSLRELFCNNNNLDKINLNTNAKLTSLYCADNNLSTLDLSSNLLLNTLSCEKNNFDIQSGSDMLNTIQVIEARENNWTSYEPQKMPENPIFNSDDVAKLLAFANQNDNVIKLKWDLSKPQYWYGVEWIKVGNEYRTSRITMSNLNLTGILDLSNMPYLESIECSYNQMTEINVSNCISLRDLSCYKTEIRTLNINNSPSIITFDCGENYLDISEGSGLMNNLNNIILKPQSRVDYVIQYISADLNMFNQSEYNSLLSFASMPGNQSILNWGANKPGEWLGVTWELIDGLYRVKSISFNYKDVTGKLNLSSFDKLSRLDCKMTKISSISLPESIRSIEALMFYDCSELTEIIIPEGVTTIGEYAFYNCVKLASVKLPETTASIRVNSFGNCESLSSITIPKNVSVIDDGAFQRCKNLSKAIFIGNAPSSFGFHVFDDTKSDFTIYYNYGSTGFTPIFYDYPCVALQDVNKDGTIDIRDIAAVSKSYNQKRDSQNWIPNYDLNSDGIINIFDLVLISKCM